MVYPDDGIILSAEDEMIYQGMKRHWGNVNVKEAKMKSLNAVWFSLCDILKKPKLQRYQKDQGWSGDGGMNQ